MDFSKHTARVITRIGEQYPYTPAGGVVRTVPGLFVSVPRDLLQIDGVAPSITCNIADVPELKRGDQFGPINGDTYKVKNKDPDSLSGLVRADLEKQ